MRLSASSLAELAPSSVSLPAAKNVLAEVLLVDNPRVSLNIAPKRCCAAVSLINQLLLLAISKISSPVELASLRIISCSKDRSGVASV